MQIKVVIYSKQQNLISKCAEEIEKILLKRGLFDFSFLSCNSKSDAEELCKKNRQECERLLLVCENNVLDDLVRKTKYDSDNMSLVCEQGVLLEETTTYRKTLFVPIELALEKFVENFVENKNVFCCSIFGKSFEFVNEHFSKLCKENEIETDYKIITKSQFVHIVYFSNQIDKEKLKAIFSENLYSFDDISLTQKVCTILLEKNLSISIADAFTYGKISSLFDDEKSKKLIKQSAVVCNEEEFEKFNISKQFLNENGAVCKENSFLLGKNMLKLSGSDIVLSIVGFDCDAGRIFITIGNKQELYVFSAVFYGDKSLRLQNLNDFILFRMLKYLQEKKL